VGLDMKLDMALVRLSKDSCREPLMPANKGCRTPRWFFGAGVATCWRCFKDSCCFGFAEDILFACFVVTFVTLMFVAPLGSLARYFALLI